MNFPAARPWAILSALAIAPVASAQPPIAPMPGPANPTLATMLEAGLDKVCSSYLARPTMTLDVLKSVAESAGYQLGASEPYSSVGKPIPGMPEPFGFHASVTDVDGTATVVMHITSSPATCQLKVMGDAAAWSAYLTKMPARRGHLLTSAKIMPDTKFSHEVYVGGIAGIPSGYTTFVSRWVGSGDPEHGLYTMINVLTDEGSGH